MLKNHVSRVFKFNGLQLRQDAAKYLAEVLKPIEESQREEWINKILNQVERQELKTMVIDLEILKQALSECSTDENVTDDQDLLNVISCYDVPRLTFAADRKKYLKDDIMGRPPPRLLAPAGSKSTVYLDRYVMLQQRTARHDLFSGKETTDKKYQLKPIEFLLGTANRLDDIIVLGMLTQITCGTYYLEDPSGVIKLDLSETKFHTGLYTENCFVLAEGWYDDDIFHVLAIGFPPAESSETTRKYFGSINFFGGPFDNCVKGMEKLQIVEKNESDAMFVFLSDVWLDEPEVQVRLRNLLSGYSEMPPTAFVLCGNFLNNSSFGLEYNNTLKAQMKALAEMIASYPSLQESRFLFVPGPKDPGAPNIYPRPPLPKYITQELKEKVPSAEFLTNPARIQYCTQNIVVFREDILTKMCRNAIYFPETGNVPDHFARTLTCQGHVAPLPLYTSPVYWDYDRSLYLYPLPDLVVSADVFEPFSAENLDCKVINPGSFQRHDYMFKTYVPATRTVEDSQVPGNDDL